MILLGIVSELSAFSTSSGVAIILLKHLFIFVSDYQNLPQPLSPSSCWLDL
jgi:hypothetical protein